MSDSVKSVEITKDNLDEFLKEVAKEYRKLAGKSEIVDLIRARQNGHKEES